MMLAAIGPRARLGLDVRGSRWLWCASLVVLTCGFGAGCVIPKLGAIVVDAGPDTEAGSQAAVEGGSSGRADGGAGASGMRARPESGSGGRGGAGAGGMKSQPGGAGGHAGVAGMAGMGGAGAAGSVPTAGAGGVAGAAVSGSGGAAGAVACVLDWGSARTKDSSFSDLSMNPGFEMNSQANVLQYVCRVAPSGMSQLAIGKAVPDFGCYGTYASGNARIGFGVESGFHVLAAITGCTPRWAAQPSAREPIDLDPLGGGLYACRGKLVDEPYSDGVASGTELGQWFRSQGNPNVYECWTQFHSSQMGQDAGSKLLTQELEVLVRDP